MEQILVSTYYRVSTMDQDPELQIQEIRRYIESQPNFKLVKEYTDHGVSGSKEKRPALDQLNMDAKSGLFQILIIWKLDRLARSLTHLVRLVNTLKEWNVGLVSLKDNLDLNSAQGKFTFHLLAAMAEFERDIIRERTVAGLAVARSRGKILGKPSTVDKDKVAQLRNRGFSIREIADFLSVSKSAVQRITSKIDCTKKG